MINVKQAGFTLIEMMISLVLGLIIMVAATSFYVDMRQSERYQKNLSFINESARSALTVMRRDFRGMDFWGCFDPNYVSNSFFNSLNSDGDGYISSDKGIGFSNNSGLNNSDSVTINTGELVNARVVEPYMDNLSANIEVDNIGTIAQNDILVLTNCKSADVFQVTSDHSEGSTVITHTDEEVDSGPGNASSELSQSYTGDTDIFRMSSNSWYLESQNGIPVLIRENNNSGKEIMALYVENMQIIYDVVGDSTIGAVVSLLFRSKDEIAETPVTYTFNGQTVTPDDRFIRKVFTSSFALRNRID
jgi:type IV pilus assembly protein PilW